MAAELLALQMGLNTLLVVGLEGLVLILQLIGFVVPLW
jgi:hypothetical protein